MLRILVKSGLNSNEKFFAETFAAILIKEGGLT